MSTNGKNMGRIKQVIGPTVDVEFDRIVEEAKRQWSDTKVAAVHRLGTVAAGEA